MYPLSKVFRTLTLYYSCVYQNMMIQNNNCFFVVGKNAKENWKIFEQADQDDMFIHMKDIPSCYVIVTLRDMKSGEYSHDDIVTGCKLCKENSSDKMSQKPSKCLYTPVKNVKKGRKIGSVIVSEFKMLYI